MVPSMTNRCTPCSFRFSRVPQKHEMHFKALKCSPKTQQSSSPTQPKHVTIATHLTNHVTIIAARDNPRDGARAKEFS